MATVIINGKRFDGDNIVCVGDNVIINGVKQTDTKVETLEITITDGKLMSIKTDKSVIIHGDVSGNVYADGSVNCKNVSGNVQSGGSVRCDDVGEDVSAGGSVNCDSVKGNVSAGGSVKCDSVTGSVLHGKGSKTIRNSVVGATGDNITILNGIHIK